MSYRILVVEDDPLNRELIHDWLEMEGYEVVLAADLRAAMDAVEQQLPHLILLDIQLGSEDGLALVSWLRQQPRVRHLPIVAVTAHASPAEQEQILAAGCNACTIKPLDFTLLQTLLRRWLDPATSAPA